MKKLKKGVTPLMLISETTASNMKIKNSLTKVLKKYLNLDPDSQDLEELREMLVEAGISDQITKITYTTRWFNEGGYIFETKKGEKITFVEK